MKHPIGNERMSTRLSACRRMSGPIILFLCVIIFSVYAFFPARAASAGRKLTVMIYMCGSNLESGYGAASADLEEIRSAGFSRDLSVLIMIGGSGSWASGYDPSECAILEASARGIRKVWSADKMNMGDPETLTAFLRFGAERYPAEHTGLILWNHGGGPVEGACWDELFSMDNLSLTEITQGISAAGMEKKIHWIGFDACLMGSLEVASMLSPYADCMIASQEKEPSFGWNYAFLRNLTGEETGEETGRRVIDSFFEGRADSKEIMTLSCLDLSKTEAARTALDGFFSVFGSGLSEEEFFSQCRIRDSVQQFGRGISPTGEDGYDLVDAVDLAALSAAGNPGAPALSEALSQLVLYSRSSEDRCGGVSLYYPFGNKTSYLEKWRDTYETLDVSSEYMQYLTAYGKVLTGEELTDWRELDTQETAAPLNPENQFTLQLTPEQQSNLASAQLLILQEQLYTATSAEHRKLIYTGKADIDENGFLSAAYTGRGLYIEQEDGTLYGPIEFGLTQDGRNLYVRMILLPEGVTDTDQFDHVVFFLNPEDTSQYPEIIRTQVWDRATRSYTSRIAFQEDRYASVQLAELGRLLPEPDERGLLPAYNSWEMGPLGIGGLAFPLPNRWRFTWIDDVRSGAPTWAVFQVTDLQQNVFCTAPIPVSSPYTYSADAVLDSADPPPEGLRLQATAVNAPQEQSLLLTFFLSRPDTRGETEYFIGDLEINGERQLSNTLLTQLKEGEVDTELNLSVSPEALYGISSLETLSVRMKTETADGASERMLTFRFDELDTAALWQNVHPLAEAEKDGVTIRLLGFSSIFVEDIRMNVLIQNSREESFSLQNRIRIGDMELQLNYPESVPAGKTALRSPIIYNENKVAGYELETLVDANPYFYLTAVSEHLLQHRGIREIASLTLFGDSFAAPEESFLLSLPEPWPIRDGKEESTYLNTSITLRNPSENPDTDIPPLVMAETEEYTLACDTLLIGKNGAALGLILYNRSEQPLEVTFLSAKINGTDAPLGADSFFFETAYQVRPGCASAFCLPFGGSLMSPLPSEMQRISLTFSVRKEGEAAEKTCVLNLNDTIHLGTDRPQWISPEQLIAERTDDP